MCTSVRFSDKKGNMFFGRNLDWVTGFNENIIITPRGYKDTKYTVIGMGIIEENTPGTKAPKRSGSNLRSKQGTAV